MEKGHLRADANVSIRPEGSVTLNTKTEIKNVNSIVSVREAIQKEIERQIQVVETGKRVQPWTLDWDDESGTLRVMRTKESEADYRYFHEPDLLPIEIDPGWREEILAKLPELPLERRTRFMTAYGLPDYDADILTGERSLSDYFEAAVRAYDGDPKRVSNWMMNDVLRMINDRGVTAGELALTPKHLAKIIAMVDADTINTNTGKALLDKVEETGRPPEEIVQAEGLAQVGDMDAIQALSAEVLADHPDQVAAYQGGKVTLIGWFIGQVMRKSGGKADPQKVRAALEDLLRDKPPEG
jgi:aspartyl-tRNA(Asn)/glutamyl-tRNA(Gln) amidotransferase subunit B